MKYREHRGGFRVSMATVIEVPDKLALINAIEKRHELSGKVLDIAFEKYEDERTGWKNNYWVMVKFEKNEEFRPVGSSDEVFI